ncbi:hypothetical protein CCH79_00019352, partial [Gambusia affinis]
MSPVTTFMRGERPPTPLGQEKPVPCIEQVQRTGSRMERGRKPWFVAGSDLFLLMKASPPEVHSSPVSILNVVVFPAPFTPSNPKHSPGRTPRHRRSTARMRPIFLDLYTCQEAKQHFKHQAWLTFGLELHVTVSIAPQHSLSLTGHIDIIIINRLAADRHPPAYSHTLQEEGGHGRSDAYEEVDDDEKDVGCTGDVKPERCWIHDGSDGPPAKIHLCESGQAPDPVLYWQRRNARASPIEEEQGEDGWEVGGGGVGWQVEHKQDDDATSGRYQAAAAAAKAPAPVAAAALCPAHHVPDVVGQPVDDRVTATDELQMFGFSGFLCNQENHKAGRYEGHGNNNEDGNHHVGALQPADTGETNMLDAAQTFKPAVYHNSQSSAQCLTLLHAGEYIKADIRANRSQKRNLRALGSMPVVGSSWRTQEQSRGGLFLKVLRQKEGKQREKKTCGTGHQARNGTCDGCVEDESLLIGSRQQHGAALGTAGWYSLVHLLADVVLCHALEPGVEPQVLLYTELVKQNVVLWTHAQVLTDPIHFSADVVAVYGGRAGGGRKQACQDGPWMRTETCMKTWFVGSATMRPSLDSVVSQEGDHLVFIEVEAQVVEGQFAAGLTTRLRWLGSSSMPRISSAVTDDTRQAVHPRVTSGFLCQVMKMMGLNNAVHWVAWFITGFVQLSISVTALTAILKYGRVLLHSDPLIIWLFLTIYAVATIMFCFLVSVIYSKAKLASACGGIIYFLSYVPYMYVAIREEVAHDKITAFEKCIASLMSTTAFGLGSKYFALYEVAGVGIQWRTISQSPVEGDDFNLSLSMMMLIIDAGVYGVLTWYIEAVHPGGKRLLPQSWSIIISLQHNFPSSSTCRDVWAATSMRSYWSGSGRVETWDWPWCGGGAARLSVMEEDQACAMDQRRSGTENSTLFFLFVIEHMMPLCMVISWVYSVAMMIQHIVAEKEHRLKEKSRPAKEKCFCCRWLRRLSTAASSSLCTLGVFCGLYCPLDDSRLTGKGEVKRERHVAGSGNRARDRRVKDSRPPYVCLAGQRKGGRCPQHLPPLRSPFLHPDSEELLHSAGNPCSVEEGWAGSAKQQPSTAGRVVDPPGGAAEESAATVEEPTEGIVEVSVVDSFSPDKEAKQKEKCGGHITQASKKSSKLAAKRKEVSDSSNTESWFSDTSDTIEGLRVEPLLLHIERSQLRWLGHLVRMPPGRFLIELIPGMLTLDMKRVQPQAALSIVSSCSSRVEVLGSVTMYLLEPQQMALQAALLQKGPELARNVQPHPGVLPTYLLNHFVHLGANGGVEDLGICSHQVNEQAQVPLFFVGESQAFPELQPDQSEIVFQVYDDEEPLHISQVLQQGTQLGLGQGGQKPGLLHMKLQSHTLVTLIFNSEGPTSWIHGPNLLNKKPADKLLQIKSMDGGEDPGRAANRKAVVQIISWALGLSAASGNRVEQLQGIQELEGVLLTESMLKFLTCGERGDIQLRKILLVPEKQQPALHAYHSLMCSREEGQRSERFRQLSKELREQINTQNVADK